MLMYCRMCERALRDKQKVQALVVAEYKELASKKTYAISKPEDCLDIVHFECGEAIKDD